MKRCVPWILAFLAATPCAAHFDRAVAVANYQQWLRQSIADASPSELALHDHLLELTPVGSSPEQVRNAIISRLHKSPSSYTKNYFTNNHYVVGSVGLRYAETPSWLLVTGTDTDVTWYFDGEDKLINIVVWEHPYGL